MTLEEKRAKAAAYAREYRRLNPERVAVNDARSYDRTGSRTREKQREALAALKDRPCTDCGVRYPPYVMQFDHRDPAAKLFPIDAMAMTRDKAKLAAELEKCDLVCANCHAERTHQQRLSGQRFGGRPRVTERELPPHLPVRERRRSAYHDRPSRVPECGHRDRAHKARGMCDTCYRRWRLAGKESP